MKKSTIALLIAGCFASGTALAQASPDDLQKALLEAKQAAERAQAAATAAQAALAQLQQQATLIQAKVDSSKKSVPSTTSGNTPLVYLGDESQNFSISGVIDVGLKHTSNSDSTKNKTELINNNMSTSLIWFKGNKVISDSLSAAFLFEWDINPTKSSLANESGAGNAYQGTPFQGEQYLSLTGSFGDLKLGAPNSSALMTNNVAQPFSTALGGGYSPAFGRMGSSKISGINQFDGNTVGRIVRHEKTIKYTTPKFYNIEASVEHSFENDNSPTPTSNTNGYDSISLRYSKGPLNAMYTYANEKAGSKAAAGPETSIGTAGAVVLPANTDVKFNFLAANYTIGKATIMGGYSKTKHDAAKPLEDSSSWNIATKYVVSPKVELLGNYLVRDTNLAATADVKLLGLGLNYYLDSKTVIYGRYEGLRFESVGATSSVKQDIWATGVQYKF